MVITFGLERLLEDKIAISVEGDHDVLVPRHALIGKWPKLSLYSLLRGYTLMKP
jgi:hypothetical protein